MKVEITASESTWYVNIVICNCSEVLFAFGDTEQKFQKNKMFVLVRKIDHAIISKYDFPF